MAKINLHSFRARSNDARPMTFRDTDADGKEVELTLWLRPVKGGILTDAAMGLAEELTQRYVTGGWIDGDGKPVSEPIPLPAYGGAALEVSARFVRTAAWVLTAQKAPDGEEYSFEEIAAIANTFPIAWEEIIAAIALHKGDEAPKE